MAPAGLMAATKVPVEPEGSKVVIAPLIGSLRFRPDLLQNLNL
jgi:hypothetical protein